MRIKVYAGTGPQGAFVRTRASEKAKPFITSLLNCKPKSQKTLAHEK